MIASAARSYAGHVYKAIIDAYLIIGMCGMGC